MQNSCKLEKININRQQLKNNDIYDNNDTSMTGNKILTSNPLFNPSLAKSLFVYHMNFVRRNS